MNKYIVALMVAITLLAVNHVSYAEEASEWHERRLESYENGLDTINNSLNVSPYEGYETAIGYAAECGEYLVGFYYGMKFIETLEGIYKQRYPVRHDLGKKYGEYLDLAGKAVDFATTHDFAQAFSFALQSYVLACGYKIILQKKMYDTIESHDKP